MFKTCNQLNYDPNDLKPGVVHIGFGNFSRAFIGEYLHDVATTGEKNWGYIAVAPSARQKLDLETLVSQKYIYHLLKKNGHEICTRVGALKDIMIGQNMPSKVIQQIANKHTKLVTLTITQTGYCVGLDRKVLSTKEISKDFKAIKEEDYNQVKTVPGWIAAALYKRYKHDMTPFTVVSCDNISRNGDLTASVIKHFAEQVSPNFKDYVKKTVCFPNSVVDRVTPLQNYESNTLHLQTKYNISGDNVPIICEPYRKLVIEDVFTHGTRPPLDKILDADTLIKFVKDIEPYEDRKLRLLNGSHLAIGIVSKLLQVTTVKKATQDRNIRPFWLAFLNQAAEPLRPLPVDNYIKDTIERLDNPHLTDQIDRLLSSTTTKICARLLNLPALEQKMEFNASSFAIAAWLQYLMGRDSSGNPYNLHESDTHKGDVIKENLCSFLLKDSPIKESQHVQSFVKSIEKNLTLIESTGLRKAMASQFPEVPNRKELSPSQFIPSHIPA